MTPGFWSAPLPILIVSLFLYLFPVFQCQLSVLILLLLFSEALNTPALVSHPLVYFPKRKQWRPPRLLPFIVLVFSPALGNPSPAFSHFASQLLCSRMKDEVPEGSNLSSISTYDLIHLRLMYFALLESSSKWSPTPVIFIHGFKLYLTC